MAKQDLVDYVTYAVNSITNPDLSVIVPVYNMAEKSFLSDCFCSLCAGEQVSFELICIDDCSTDGTLDVLLEYAQQYPNMTVLGMKHNSKQGAARNRGLDLARGRYIAFLDPDDFLSPGYYQKLIKHADTNKCDVVASAFQFTNEEGSPAEDVILPYPKSCLGEVCESTLKEILLVECPIVAGIYLRSIFDEPDSRFPEHVYFEDNPARVRWKLNFQKLGQVPDSIYYWRRYSTSTTALSKLDPKKIEDRIATSSLILKQATSRDYALYKEELDFLFLRLGVVNTINAMQKLNHKDRDILAISIKEAVRSKVPKYRFNTYVKKMPFFARTKYLLSCWSPKLTLRCLDLMSLFAK